MISQRQCIEAMDIKQRELEFLIGTSRWVAHRTVAPSGGRGMVTGITVGCVQRQSFVVFGDKYTCYETT